MTGLSAPLEGRRVRLRPIAAHDQQFIYALMTAPDSGGRVRFGGATPSPEKVAGSLWDAVLAQFVVEGARDRQPLGLVAITSPDFRNGYAYVSALATTAAQQSGLVVEAVLLGFNYAFSTWPFRKIYMEASQESFESFRSGLGRYFAEEGRLRDHLFVDGRYVDMVTLAVYRETWSRHVQAMLPRLCETSAGSGVEL